MQDFMQDLNANLFYKAKFEIAAQNGQDLLWTLVQKIQNWMVNKWRRHGVSITRTESSWKGLAAGGRISSHSGMVSFVSELFQPEAEEPQRCWACRITESRQPNPGFATRVWTTEVGFRQEQPGRAAVSLVLSYGDRPGFIGPCEPAPDASVPKLLKLIFEDKNLQCSMSGIPLSLSPILLRPEDVAGFWRIVAQPDRDVAVVYLSPRQIPGSDRMETLLSPESLVNTLGPNALVYYADDPETVQEMTRQCPDPRLNNYPGTLRIYTTQPRLDDPDDSVRHRFIQASLIEEWGVETVTGILRRALAQDVYFFETGSLVRIEDCRRMQEREKTRQKLAQAQASAQAAQSKAQLLVQQAQEALRETQAQALEQIQESARAAQALALEQAQATVEREVKQAQDALLEDVEKLENRVQALEEQVFNLELEKEDLVQKLYNANSQADAYRQSAQQSDARERALKDIRNFKDIPSTPQEVVKYFLALYPDRMVFTERGKASLKDCPTQPDLLWQVLYDMCTILYPLYTEGDGIAVDQAFTSKSRFRMGRGQGANTHQNKTIMKQYEDTYNGRTINIEPHIATNEQLETSPRFLRIYFCYDAASQKIVVGSCGKHLDNSSTRKTRKNN